MFINIPLSVYSLLMFYFLNYRLSIQEAERENVHIVIKTVHQTSIDSS